MLEMLLSFTEFDRDWDIGCVRDKLIASKKKVSWMHGLSPLGYDLKNRRLARHHSLARDSRCSPHFNIASKAGQSACPHGVNRYSTLGGTCG